MSEAIGLLNRMEQWADSLEIMVDEGVATNKGNSSMDAQTDVIDDDVPQVSHRFPPRDMCRVQEGVEAFEKERDGLLKTNRDHVAAYEGGKRVAIARTHRKLHRILDKIEGLKRAELFVACILPPPDDEEVSLSR